jgi:hypothetical protein
MMMNMDMAPDPPTLAAEPSQADLPPGTSAGGDTEQGAIRP